jgi:hypothetical protein
MIKNLKCTIFVHNAFIAVLFEEIEMALSIPDYMKIVGFLALNNLPRLTPEECASQDFSCVLVLIEDAISSETTCSPEQRRMKCESIQTLIAFVQSQTKSFKNIAAPADVLDEGKTSTSPDCSSPDKNATSSDTFMVQETRGDEGRAGELMVNNTRQAEEDARDFLTTLFNSPEFAALEKTQERRENSTHQRSRSEYEKDDNVASIPEPKRGKIHPSRYPIVDRTDAFYFSRTLCDIFLKSKLHLHYNIDNEIEFLLKRGISSVKIISKLHYIYRRGKNLLRDKNGLYLDSSYTDVCTRSIFHWGKKEGNYFLLEKRNFMKLVISWIRSEKPIVLSKLESEYLHKIHDFLDVDSPTKDSRIKKAMN